MVIYQPSNSKNNYNYNGYMYENCNWHYHFHKNFEFVAVIDGEVNTIIDGKNYTYKKGSFFLILPNIDKHSLVWISVFSSDYVPEFADTLKGKKNIVPDFECLAETVEIFNKYILNTENPDFFMLKAGLTAICGNYLSNAQLVSREEMKNEISCETINFIEENFTKDITMKDTASALGYEYHYFSRLFSKTFMVNFKSLVNQYRLDYAQKLLIESDIDITEIAMKSGFGSIRNFNRVFKDYMNKTPLEYRGK